MNGGLNTRTLVVRLVLMLAIVGGAIVAFPQLNLDGSTTATQTAFRQRLSLQLSASEE